MGKCSGSLCLGSHRGRSNSRRGGRAGPGVMDGASARFCLGLQKGGVPSVALRASWLPAAGGGPVSGGGGLGVGRPVGRRQVWPEPGGSVPFVSNTGNRAEALVCDQPSLCLQCLDRKGC